MNTPILYSFRRCPYAIRARMALNYNKIVYEHREILLKNRPEKLYEASSKGTVPVLDLGDSIIIDESLDIMKWALSKNKEQKWYNEKLKLQDRMVYKNDFDFKKKLDLYKYHIRHPQFSQETYRESCIEIIEFYETIFKRSRYFISDKESLSDIAIFPFVRQFANVELSRFRREFPKTSTWLDSFVESKIFTSIMKKYNEWNQIDSGVLVNYSD